MANKRVILAVSPTGTDRAIGPFESDRTLSAVRDMIKKAPGWQYRETVTLISGADLPYLIGRSVADR
jgi:hypothetical protein